MVGNTGPAHLAAAVGTPVVSLFAPTVPAVRWRPWGVPHELLSSTCRARLPRARVPGAGHPCLDGVGAEDVAGGRRPPRPVRLEEVRAVRVLLWHVHGSWTTAFVQGGHDYLVPVLPDRGPDGVGRRADLRLAATA